MAVAAGKKPLYLWDLGDPHRLSEKKIEAMVMSLYRQVGIDVVKTSQPQKPAGMTIGIPDLRCYFRRNDPDSIITWWHEVKSWKSRKRPTPGQIKFHEMVRSYNEEVIVGGVNTAIEWIDIHGIVTMPALVGHW